MKTNIPFAQSHLICQYFINLGAILFCKDQGFTKIFFGTSENAANAFSACQNQTFGEFKLALTYGKQYFLINSRRCFCRSTASRLVIYIFNFLSYLGDELFAFKKKFRAKFQDSALDLRRTFGAKRQDEKRVLNRHEIIRAHLDKRSKQRLDGEMRCFGRKKIAKKFFTPNNSQAVAPFAFNGLHANIVQENSMIQQSFASFSRNSARNFSDNMFAVAGLCLLQENFALRAMSNFSRSIDFGMPFQNSFTAVHASFEPNFSFHGIHVSLGNTMFANHETNANFSTEICDSYETETQLPTFVRPVSQHQNQNYVSFPRAGY